MFGVQICCYCFGLALAPVGLEFAVLAVVRRTFFAHFCAGETADGTVDAVNRLREANVNAIMDYAAEADVEQDEIDALKDAVMHRTGLFVFVCLYMFIHSFFF